MRKLIIFLLATLIFISENASAQSVSDIVDQQNLSALIMTDTRDAVAKAGGTIGSHIVDRGETWESIASRYGVPPEIIRRLNCGIPECYTGLELEVPIMPVAQATPNASLKSLETTMLNHARKMMERKDYKGAIKQYSALIKEFPSATAYYERAAAHYNNGKLKNSMKDLMRVIHSGKESAMYPDAEELYVAISNELQEKRAERALMWGQIASVVLQTGLQVSSAIIESKAASGNPSFYIPQGGNIVSENYVPGFYAGTSFSQNTGIAIPESLKIENYLTPGIGFGEVTFDQWGNPLFSNKSLGEAMRRMNSDFANDMQKSGLLSAGSPATNTMLTTMLKQNVRLGENTASLIETPHYSFKYDKQDSDSESNKSDDSPREININHSSQISGYSSTYYGYIDLLSNMKNGFSKYSDIDRRNMQAKMKECRETANSLAGTTVINISPWENWNGK